MLRNKGLGIKAEKCLYEGVIVPTALYGAEALGMRSAERRKVNVLRFECETVSHRLTLVTCTDIAVDSSCKIHIVYNCLHSNHLHTTSDQCIVSRVIIFGVPVLTLSHILDITDIGIQ